MSAGSASTAATVTPEWRRRPSPESRRRFDFAKLRATLNCALQSDGVMLVGILFPFECGSRGVETDGLDEDIEIIDDALVEAIELRCRLHSGRLPVEVVITAGPFVDGLPVFHTFEAIRESFRS
jgi:hypothetical protein